MGPAGRTLARPADPSDALAEQERRLETLIGRWGPYVGLALGTLINLFFTDRPAGPVPPGSWWAVTGLLVLVVTGWTYAFTGRDPERAAGSPRAGAVYVVGLLAGALLLAHQSPFYGFFVFVGYYHSYSYLRGRWRWAGIGGTAVTVAYAQLGGGLNTSSWPLLLLGVAGLAVANAVLAAGFTYYGALTTELSVLRRHENAQLAEANRRLSETLDENAALQARLLAAAREAGVLDERARMAREIHDTIAQGLTGVVTQLEAAGSVDGDPVARRRHVDTAVALARESLTEARRSVAGLTPGRLATTSRGSEVRLPDAIAGMAKDWADTAGVGLVLDTTGEPRPLLPELEVVLYRVAQESLANVGRHARATRVGITLSYMEDLVVLDVRDDGVGFDPEGRRAVSDGTGFGLAAMRQRVGRVSGTLVVESGPGEGTAVSASVPAGEEG